MDTQPIIDMHLYASGVIFVSWVIVFFLSRTAVARHNRNLRTFLDVLLPLFGGACFGMIFCWILLSFLIAGSSG